MSFHKLAKAKDKRFWSVRVTTDLRLIVHRTEDSLLLCYVDHHDRAYAWAERRKLETHPTTGAAQLVEIRERVQEIVVPAYVDAPPVPAPKKMLLAHVPDAELLAHGVPAEWLADVRQATEDTVLALADHLPAEAAEAVLELATGGTPRRITVTTWSPTLKGWPRLAPVAVDPFDHPDARRRFRVVTDVDELARALDYPWERWTVFLHPAQRELVERRFGGPARIAGSAGTGKTVVALHRAAHLARANPDARILLTTFSETLASALRTKLVRLIGTEPRLRERIDVDALDAVARRLHDRMLGRAEVAPRAVVRDVIQDAAGQSTDQRFSMTFLSSEWTEVVDAWQIDSWEAYRDVARLGRRTRLPEKQRQALWVIFERVRVGLRERKLLTQADLYSRLAGHLSGGERLPYDFVVVDEAQDLSVVASSLPSAAAGRKRSSLPATSGSGSSRSPSPGSRSAWTSAAGRGRSGSTTGRRIRSGRERTGCWASRSPTWTATQRSGAARSRCSMGRIRCFAYWPAPRKSPRWLAAGWPSARRRGWCRGR